MKWKKVTHRIASPTARAHRNATSQMFFQCRNHAIRRLFMVSDHALNRCRRNTDIGRC
ncbi:hypothetical protein GJA_2817 [Janthinobacterium agaricidamnosum NBRC 102515 = DSM 9628]|uniref:Uncharacterized protein n=1 Tax=Janthinobacterium agaricidamnosum NBRC 102515 = DSM 9628 TaxID=1349767 RepID=W0V7Z5_9BURK|nr:hypothetical protein GJA_2817 [Janthinobacterium agaricidamnosum NBRC 102515 = DSM 9628]